MDPHKMTEEEMSKGKDPANFRRITSTGSADHVTTQIAEEEDAPTSPPPAVPINPGPSVASSSTPLLELPASSKSAPSKNASGPAAKATPSEQPESDMPRHNPHSYQRDCRSCKCIVSGELPHCFHCFHCIVCARSIHNRGMYCDYSPNPDAYWSPPIDMRHRFYEFSEDSTDLPQPAETTPGPVHMEGHFELEPFSDEDEPPPPRDEKLQQLYLSQIEKTFGGLDNTPGLSEDRRERLRPILESHLKRREKEQQSGQADG